MRKFLLVFMFMAAFAPAGLCADAPASQEVLAKLAEIQKSQQEILRQIGEIKQEIQVLKIRIRRS